MDSSSYGAHASVLIARFGVRAAEDGHSTLFKLRMGAWHVKCSGCQPTQLTQMTQGIVQRGGQAIKVLHERALIKQNLGPTVGQ